MSAKERQIPHLEIIRQREPYRFEKVVLANGGEFYFQRAEIPFVRLGISFKFGSREDPPGKEGLVHMLEHLLSTKTEKFPSFLAMRKYEDTHGIWVNYGTTFPDSCQFSGSCLKQDFPYLLEILSQLILFSSYGEKELALEKGRVIQELRQTMLPQMRKIQREVGEEIFANHPLSRVDNLGEEETITALKLKDIKEFARQYLVPQNAAFVLIGNFKLNEARNLLEKYFPPQDGYLVPEYPPIAPPSPLKLRSEYSLSDLGIKGERQTTLEWSFAFPKTEWAELCWIIFPLLRAKLHDELSSKKRWAYRVENRWWRIQDLAGAWFTTSLSPKQEKGAEKVFWEVMEKGERDIQMFKLYQQISLKSLLSIDTNYSSILNYVLGSLKVEGQIVTLQETYQKTASLTPQEFQSFFKKYISPERTHLTIIRP